MLMPWIQMVSDWWGLCFLNFSLKYRYSLALLQWHGTNILNYMKIRVGRHLHFLCYSHALGWKWEGPTWKLVLRLFVHLSGVVFHLPYFVSIVSIMILTENGSISLKCGPIQIIFTVSYLKRFYNLHGISCGKLQSIVLNTLFLSRTLLNIVLALAWAFTKWGVFKQQELAFHCGTSSLIMQSYLIRSEGGKMLEMTKCECKDEDSAGWEHTPTLPHS